nr:radical SAM family heme chaperone HemW [Roseiarcus fermentans]
MEAERARAAPQKDHTADDDPGFGVYVHWPFCLSKCPYCDFNSHVRGEPIDQARYLAAFSAEIAHRAALAPGRVVRSIFFGGGTPSLMSPGTVGGILDAIAAHWRVDAGAEVTLEANPTSVEAGRFRGYRAAGVNRLSVGVQALADADLQALGRRHSVEEALAAVRLAASLFPRFTFDLIYGRPGQSLAAWRAELARALDLAGDHISLYQLTVEPDTAFERLRDAGKLELPDEDLSLAFFRATRELTEARGLLPYEVSNHARPGGESRHNLVYWRYGEYAGIGPGAHGRIVTARGRLAQACERLPEPWLGRVESDGHGLVEDSALTPEEQGDEFLLMGLRLSEGVDPRRYEALSGRTLDRDRLRSLIDDGFLERGPSGRIRVTSLGAPLLDTVVADVAA